MSEVKDLSAVQAPAAIEQPASQPQPVAQPQQQGFLAKHRTDTGSHEWKDGLFDCCTGENNLCLKGWCCPCFVYGRTQARLRDPTLAGYERLNTDCLMFCGASYCGLAWLFPFFRRGEIRSLYDIKGNVVGDCLGSCCCSCCVLIQHEKEVIHRQTLQQSKPEQDGYKAVPGMTTGQE